MRFQEVFRTTCTSAQGAGQRQLLTWLPCPGETPLAHLPQGRVPPLGRRGKLPFVRGRAERGLGQLLAGGRTVQ